MTLEADLLNNPVLNKAQFDLRNEKLHVFDEDLLKDYDHFEKEGKINPNGPNFTIFHLIGQHGLSHALSQGAI